MHMVDTILEAAARVFDQHGYEGANTNRVAERAGVSVGSVYQYFPNKNALLTALHERHYLQMQAVVDRALDAAQGRTLRAVIEDIVAGALALHRAEPRLQRILHVEYPYFEKPPGTSRSAGRLFERSRALLEAHRTQMGRDDLDLATHMVLRMVESLVHAAVLDPPVTDAGAHEAAIADAVEGYLKLRR
ncbi:TetR/AcrR family transcriptional regulator [Corallococcus macrosporus]|uniref:TetR family transcriptional regulator n=1 Tax=Corallococcus macrosporus DSM 14697 TaxID=1189310 RepID=A0A250K182_9BACT|nr:TetR/AcrR family transcriptional regulator [Corallococcus macrosporus]ATB49497.1 TetR family transcriptional regulator [Corallococcus macrosporus DSM 14697]